MERSEISRHQIAVLQSLASGTWRTTKDIAGQASIAQRTARAHATRLAEIGILERADSFPARFRLSEGAAERHHNYFSRLRKAAEAMNIPLDL